MFPSTKLNPKDEVKILKKQLQQAENQLLQEQLLRKSLEEQFQKPVNIHQWRHLQNNEPEKFQLLEKVNALNKRLTKKCVEVADKDAKLKAKCDEISLLEKRCIEKDTSIQAMEKQLRNCEKSLKQLSELKTNLVELTAVRSQCKQYEVDLNVLTEELKVLKMNAYLSGKLA